jgi:cytidylate kinase
VVWDNWLVESDIIITIDGTAASGKSTTAREVSRQLGYIYLDTGAMYRALTLKVLREGIDPSDAQRLSLLAETTEIQVDKEGRVWVDGMDVTSEIRSPEVDRIVSIVSAIQVVRERLVSIQREIGKDGGVVCEGRDTGTVVFPEADLKIYMRADLSERARRRTKELKEKEIVVSQGEVETGLEERDRLDSNRTHSPLVVPEGAIVIDTTHLTREEEVERVLHEVARLRS